jgi:hypothetical protein
VKNQTDSVAVLNNLVRVFCLTVFEMAIAPQVKGKAIENWQFTWKLDTRLTGQNLANLSA